MNVKEVKNTLLKKAIWAISLSVKVGRRFINFRRKKKKRNA